MRKEEYTRAEMQVTEFATEDVITSSTPVPDATQPTTRDVIELPIIPVNPRG